MISRSKVSFAFFADLGVFARNDGWGPKTRFAEERQGSAKTTKHPRNRHLRRVEEDCPDIDHDNELFSQP